MDASSFYIKGDEVRERWVLGDGGGDNRAPLTGNLSVTHDDFFRLKHALEPPATVRQRDEQIGAGMQRATDLRGSGAKTRLRKLLPELALSQIIGVSIEDLLEWREQERSHDMLRR
mgnify:FL=1